MEPYEDIVDEWLRRDREMPRKQRHTAKRVFDRLVAEHRFQGAGQHSTNRSVIRSFPQQSSRR